MNLISNKGVSCIYVLQHLIYQAYHHWKQGEALPMDIFMGLISYEVSPQRLENMFNEGLEDVEAFQVIKEQKTKVIKGELN